MKPAYLPSSGMLDSDPHAPPPSIQHRFFNDYDRVDHILESPPRNKFGMSGVMQSMPLPFDFVRASPRVLGTAGVAAITFFYGCGGPLGSEDIVAMGGPMTAMLALTIYPFVFTIPYGAVVAELCSAFPEDGGFTIWVTNAFGSFWGTQIGYWSWVAGIFGGAIYPAYLLDFICQYGHVEISSSALSYMLKVCIGIALALPTFLSTRWIGRGAVALLCCVYIPLTLYMVWCYAKYQNNDQLNIVRHVNSTEANWDDPAELENGVENSYYEILNAVFWNYDGIQMASVFGGQVLNPARVYSRAITITLALTMCAYVLPIPSTLVTQSVDWTAFTRGVYVEGAVAIGGQFLRVLMMISTLSSNIGLFMSSLFCKSFEMAGMADSQLLPRVFGIRNATFGSPQYSILVTMVLTVGLAGVDTGTLLPVTNVFAALVTSTIFISAIQLRYTLPFMPRPTRVPGGMVVIVLISMMPILICAYLIVKNVILGVKEALMIAGFLAPGLLLGFVQSRNRSSSYPN